jgi:hypothetical protein
VLYAPPAISNTMNEDPLDRVDRHLKAMGHDKWGWVVYRCTYGSDNDWSEFMKKLEALSKEWFDFYFATEAMRKKHIWNFIDDRDRLENASKSDVRRMFNEWVQSPEAAAEQPNAKDPMSKVGTSRYRFCMHVDETSLRSVLDDSRDWHINLINRDWTPAEDASDDDDEDDENANEACEDYILPEIEGCTDEDVGWTKASIGIVLGRYISLCNPSFWYAYYSRPPLIADVSISLQCLDQDTKN